MTEKQMNLLFRGLPMIFGIGRGKMDIRIVRREYRPGEAIDGTLWLDLKESVMARGVSVALVGERKVVRHQGKGTQVSTERVFEFALPLDGEKSYAPGGSEYRFTITVPQSIQGLLPQGESMSGLMKVVRFLSSPNPIRWYLDAKLDVPKSVDVSKRVQINIV